jgi:hypothetical protein
MCLVGDPGRWLERARVGGQKSVGLGLGLGFGLGLGLVGRGWDGDGMGG